MEKEEDIKIIFHIESVEIETFRPSCIIYYTKNKILFHLETRMSASLLRDNNCYTVFSFLEKNYQYMVNLLKENNERTTSEFVEENIKNKENLKSGKNKLLTILRKQKINNLLS